MPSRQGSQNRGGKKSGGKPACGQNLSKNAGHALTQEVREAIQGLPQISEKEWSKSYLAEQLWRNYLGLPADYDWADLEQIADGNILE